MCYVALMGVASRIGASQADDTGAKLFDGLPVSEALNVGDEGW
jgi:hypothetical protein